MKILKNYRLSLFTPAVQRTLALLSVWALISSTLMVGAASAQQTAERRRLSEEQRILHVLNRLGFGARAGDVEHVRKMGLERYIDQQLHPEAIDDAVAEAKIKELPSLAMTTPELFAKYPQTNMLIRQLQQRGQLPADLAALRENRVKGATPAMPNADANAKQGASDVMTPPANGTPAVGDPTKGVFNNEEAKGGKENEYRKAIRDYYMQNNLQPPQRITAELQASRILRAVYSERQLQEVMVDFWSNHFNVFAGKGADRWLLVSYDRDTIRPNTMGRFRDLLEATAKSPAMLFYLDNFQSVSPNAPQGGFRREQRMEMRQVLDPQMRERFRALRFDNKPGMMRQQDGGQINAPQQAQAQQPPQPKRPKRGINENYARELMELHTLGVDGGYTQKDVQEVARCFTGWTIFDPRGYAANALGGAMADRAGQFFFNPRLHDDGEKIVLGHKIPAGGGIKDGEMVLDILAHHPSTAKFIATKLCRRFVADNPSPALVARVAAAFTKSDGDIRQTLRAIFTSPEFNSPEAYRAKIKSPFELAVSAIRTLGGETNGGPPIHQWIAKMGEPLYQYQAPTGYPDTAEAWVNTGALLERLNFALALVSNRIPGTRVNLARFIGESANNGAVDKARVVDQFADVILQGDMSPRTKASLLKQLNEAANNAPAVGAEMSSAATPPSNMRTGRRQMQSIGAANVNTEVARIAGLILGSPEFQRQ